MALRSKCEKQKDKGKTILWWASRKWQWEKEECRWKLLFNSFKTEKIDNVGQKEEDIRFSGT